MSRGARAQTTKLASKSDSWEVHTYQQFQVFVAELGDQNTLPKRVLIHQSAEDLNHPAVHGWNLDPLPGVVGNDLFVCEMSRPHDDLTSLARIEPECFSNCQKNIHVCGLQCAIDHWTVIVVHHLLALNIA